MKRFTLILALVLMVAMPSFAEHVSSATAQKAAATFLNNNGAKSTQITDLSKAAGFPNLYIFTTEQSFVVMSADDRVQPILGYSLTGKFVAGNMPTNVRGWLQGYNDEIRYAIDNQLRATAETTKLWKDLTEGKNNAAKTTVVVAPLIQTKWNQNKYYNNLCPEAAGGPDGHAYTGCVATAMAQIMKYWESPTYGIGSYSYQWNGQTLSADFGATTYDWSNMSNYYEYYYDDEGIPHWLPNPSSVEIAAVATLMYHCGVSVNMNYGGGSSGASSAAVAYALKTYFNYCPDIDFKYKSDYGDAEWETLVKNELNENRPLHYSGQDSSSGGGHAFVCDGYDNANYFHFNWGWAGHYNGYFSLSNLNTGANGEPGSGNGNYTSSQFAIFGIKPSTNNAIPTNLTYTLNGLQEISLNWTGASGAVSYNIYRNDNLIGNTTTNTYNETAPFGTNVYYIRSVNSEGDLSLPSNLVSITINYPLPAVNDLTAMLSGNNVSLSWTAPEWCYPETPSAILTYGDGTPSGYSLGYNNGTNLYWGHKYLSESLGAYNNMALYKVSFYANETGAYKLFIYQGTTSNRPQTQILEQTVNVGLTGWFDIDLTNTLLINASKDYWVFIYDPEGRGYPAEYGSYSGNYGNFFSTAPTSWVSSMDGLAFLIRTYVTDGTYTYNLYRNDEMIAQNLSNTTYNTQLSANNANYFCVKTNYYGGEAESNKIGFAKGNATLPNLNIRDIDQMTVTEGSKLTVSGTLSNDNTQHLILENGAQLIHNSNDVKATVKKSIAPYTADDNGWYFIASPVLEAITPSTANGLLNGVYDLYYYDEPTYYWMNYRDNAFDLAYKQGYLYASDANTPLQFAGTLAPSNSSVNVDGLSYSSTILKGFNLVGNPFACNATVDQDCYIIDNDQGIVVLAEQTPIIAPCEGVFVKATASDNSVTFTKSTGFKDAKARDCLDLVITQGRSTADRARVRFGEGIGMEKYNMDGKHSQISLLQNGQDFAVAYANEGNEMPINFKAAKNGTYTLSIEAEELELDYLHLIDNLTGNDVDLLASPSYTFEAKASDYASRFNLVFDNNGSSTGSETFAYISDGNIIINNEGEATLQIVDMTGRVVVEGEGLNRVSTSELTPGVYVLHLIDGEMVHTQKIVVE